MIAKPYIPFTRPHIDEDTIAAVAVVLRSGQLSSGPKVLEFEATSPPISAARSTFAP